MSGDIKKQVSGLVTSEVFLDTTVYRSFGHNLSRPLFDILLRHIQDGLINLHSTDITLLEVERQISEAANKVTKDYSDSLKKLDSFFDRPGLSSTGIVDLVSDETDKHAAAAFKSFQILLRTKFKADVHEAMLLPASEIFTQYFDSLGLFADRKGKQFPDAFMHNVLSNWCTANKKKMYIVTNDKAFGNTASEDDNLIHLKSLDDLLDIISSAQNRELIDLVCQLVEENDVQNSLADTMETWLAYYPPYYAGDKMDVEIIECEVDRSEGLALRHASIFNEGDDGSFTALISLQASVGLELAYSDTSDAMYDKETGEYFGAETVSSTISEDITLRFIIEGDKNEKSITDQRVITKSVAVFDHHDFWQ